MRRTCQPVMKVCQKQQCRRYWLWLSFIFPLYSAVNYSQQIYFCFLARRLEDLQVILKSLRNQLLAQLLLRWSNKQIWSALVCYFSDVWNLFQNSLLSQDPLSGMMEAHSNSDNLTEIAEVINVRVVCQTKTRFIFILIMDYDSYNSLLLLWGCFSLVIYYILSWMYTCLVIA